MALGRKCVLPETDQDVVESQVPLEILLNLRLYHGQHLVDLSLAGICLSNDNHVRGTQRASIIIFYLLFSLQK
jgi:hypothetical protein